MILWKLIVLDLLRQHVLHMISFYSIKVLYWVYNQCNLFRFPQLFIQIKTKTKAHLWWTSNSNIWFWEYVFLTQSPFGFLGFSKVFLRKGGQCCLRVWRLLWGEDTAFLFEQGIADCTGLLAQSLTVHCDLCPTIVGLSALPSVREDQKQSVNEPSIVYLWLLLPLLSASHSCSIVFYRLVSSPETLWKLDSPGMGKSLLNVCPSQRTALDNLCSFSFEKR